MPRKTRTAEDDELYRLTPAAILHCIVKEWGLTDEWNTKVYNAAFSDLMATLVRSGIVEGDGERR